MRHVLFRSWFCPLSTTDLKLILFLHVNTRAMIFFFWTVSHCMNNHDFASWWTSLAVSTKLQQNKLTITVYRNISTRLCECVIPPPVFAGESEWLQGAGPECSSGIVVLNVVQWLVDSDSCNYHNNQVLNISLPSKETPCPFILDCPIPLLQSCLSVAL